jgi:hypothetical protein
MRHALLATFFLAAAAALFQPLEAQQIRSPYRFIDERQSLGIYAGSLITNPGTPEVGPQSAPIFGIRYNLRFTGPLSGEAAVSFVPSERQVISEDTLVAGFQPLVVGESSMNLVHVEAGLRFHLTGPRAWRGFAPYVVATGGLAGDLTGQGELDESLPEQQRFRFGPSFAVGVGAGTDWFLTERLSLRLEARNHIFRLPIPAGVREELRAETQWTNNLGLSLGTALHF